jgi:hypothetical protein
MEFLYRVTYEWFYHSNYWYFIANMHVDMAFRCRILILYGCNLYRKYAHILFVILKIRKHFLSYTLSYFKPHVIRYTESLKQVNEID